MKLLLGSNNRHKQREMQEIFDQEAPGMIELLRTEDVLEEIIDVDETGATLEENAYLKAKAFYDASGLPCVADDTGLEIDALGGAPGVHSARFAGESCDSAANRRKALTLLANVPDEETGARFRTVICFYDGRRAEYIEGVCRGRIIREERGDGGFGYDSLFVPDGSTDTFAQMPAEKKNKISHRGRAAVNFVGFLKKKDVLFPPG